MGLGEAISNTLDTPLVVPDEVERYYRRRCSEERYEGVGIGEGSQSNSESLGTRTEDFRDVEIS